MKIIIQEIDQGENSMEMRLSDLKQGDEAVICKFLDNGNSLLRLRDMGLLTGTFLRVIRFAPLGDPIEIKTRGYYLSIRKSAAKHILVNKKYNT